MISLFTKTFDKKLQKIVKSNNIQNPNIRYVVRMSGTEPLIRILLEGENENQLSKALKKITNEVKKILNDK